MVRGVWGKRGATSLVGLGLLVGGFALAPTVTNAELPDCAHAPVRLSPLYARNVPGQSTPEAATAHLAAVLDQTVDLGANDLDFVVAERRGDTAVVTTSDALALRGVAMTTTHPAGGWMVDEFWTCARGAGQ